MNSRARIAAAVGAGVAVIIGAFVLVAVGGDGDSGVSAGSSTTSSSTTTTAVEETTTTVDLVPETSTSTTVARTPSTTTTTAAPLPVVGASGAVLQASSSAATRKMQGQDCSSLADQGWTSSGCGSASVKGGGTVVWLVETALPKGTRVLVFGPSGNGWRVLLEAKDDNGTRWKADGVVVRVVDLSGDKADDVVAGFRAASGDSLAMDVVEGSASSASVTAHRDLAGGRSRVSTGQWDTWALLSSGKYQHDTIRWQDNAWRIVLRTESPASDVPPSQF